MVQGPSILPTLAHWPETSVGTCLPLDRCLATLDWPKAENPIPDWPEASAIPMLDHTSIRPVQMHAPSLVHRQLPGWLCKLNATTPSKRLHQFHGCSCRQAKAPASWPGKAEKRECLEAVRWTSTQLVPRPSASLDYGQLQVYLGEGGMTPYLPPRTLLASETLRHPSIDAATLYTSSFGSDCSRHSFRATRTNCLEGLAWAPQQLALQIFDNCPKGFAAKRLKRMDRCKLMPCKWYCPPGLQDELGLLDAHYAKAEFLAQCHGCLSDDKQGYTRPC